MLNINYSPKQSLEEHLIIQSLKHFKKNLVIITLSIINKVKKLPLFNIEQIFNQIYLLDFFQNLVDLITAENYL
jgi:hypothetical protein